MRRTPPPPDRWGYRGYCVCLMVHGPIGDAVLGIRSSLGVTQTMHPHVTVKGTFVSPDSLDLVRDLVRQQARQLAPLELRLSELLVWGGERRLLVVSVDTSPALQALHENLYQAIEPISTNIYGGTGEESVRGFHYHVTIYQGVDEATHSRGLGAAERLPLPVLCQADSLHLMGRATQEDGTSAWTVVNHYPFGMPSDR